MPTIVRYLVFVVVVTGCTFTAAGPVEEIQPGPDPSPQPCAAGEQGVALCVDFADEQLAEGVTDRSQYKNIVAATNVQSTERVPGEQAAVLRKESRLLIRESDRLDLPELTLEMWIRPDQKPPKRGSGLFDNHGRYTMDLKDNRKVRCGVFPDAGAESGGAVPDAIWSHVACSYAAGTMRVYINGQLSRCEQMVAIPIVSPAGSTIGGRFNLTGIDVVDRFVGGVDNVRIYERALTPEDICLAAGQRLEDCNRECPDGERDDD